ncbi:MAG: hypothetical protein E7523_03820 [Ruminococcaceae bacterium]|nr:hypothetical protein [Oscillospiraceae bacterium]
MKKENNISASAVVSFLIDRKYIFYSVLSCLIGLITLILGMIICDKSFWNYMFVWILPGAGLVLLGTYAISMMDKHPIILIFPPIIFFASLFIRYLVTYEYLIFLFLFLQMIPFLVFWANIVKKELYNETHIAVTTAVLSVICFLIAVIAVNILERADIVSLPKAEHVKLEILTYVEIATAAFYYGIGFLNKDMRISNFLMNDK